MGQRTEGGSTRSGFGAGVLRGQSGCIYLRFADEIVGNRTLALI